MVKRIAVIGLALLGAWSCATLPPAPPAFFVEDLPAEATTTAAAGRSHRGRGRLGRPQVRAARAGEEVPDEARHGQPHPRSGPGLRGPPLGRSRGRRSAVQVLDRGDAGHDPVARRPGPDLRIPARAGQGLRRVQGHPRVRSRQPLDRAAVQGPPGRPRQGRLGFGPHRPGRGQPRDRQAGIPARPVLRPRFDGRPPRAGPHLPAGEEHGRGARPVPGGHGSRHGGQSPPAGVRGIPGRVGGARAEPRRPREAGRRRAEGRVRRASGSRSSGPSWASTRSPASTTGSRPSRPSPARTWPP